MKRPILLALEFVLALSIATVAGWVANRFSRKENRQAQALERAASYEERIAEALERAYPKSPCSAALAEAQHRYSIMHPDELVPVCNPW